MLAKAECCMPTEHVHNLRVELYLCSLSVTSTNCCSSPPCRMMHITMTGFFLSLCVNVGFCMIFIFQKVNTEKMRWVDMCIPSGALVCSPKRNTVCLYMTQNICTSYELNLAYILLLCNAIYKMTGLFSVSKCHVLHDFDLQERSHNEYWEDESCPQILSEEHISPSWCPSW